MLPTLITCALVTLSAQSTRPSENAVPSTRPAEMRVAEDLDWRRIVLERAGKDVWPTVKRLKFTFNVERNGQTTSVQHDWDLTTGVDTVTWDGKTVPVDVWRYNEATANEDQKAAFRRWTNDGYWLLMPLKLDDPGVHFTPARVTRDMPPSRANVTMSFDDVGLTPGDEYDLSIDLRRGVVDQWTYRPDAERAVTWRWEDYQDFNGLYLATERVPVSEGAPRIYFTDVEVTTEGTKSTETN